MQCNHLLGDSGDFVAHLAPGAFPIGASHSTQSRISPPEYRRTAASWSVGTYRRSSAA